MRSPNTNLSNSVTPNPMQPPMIRQFRCAVECAIHVILVAEDVDGKLALISLLLAERLGE